MKNGIWWVAVTLAMKFSFSAEPALVGYRDHMRLWTTSFPVPNAYDVLT